MNPKNMTLFALMLLVVTACGTEGGDDTTATDDPAITTTLSDAGQEETTTPTTEPMETTTTATAETTTMAAAMDGVHVADTDLGPILVDPDGFTVYVFDADTEGESTCYNACADRWPPVSADTPIGSDIDGSLFASSPRTDGSEQLTVNGMPLYRYSPDTKPGDTTGQGFNGVWWVVDADGNVVEAAAGDEGVIDYEY